MLKARRMLDHRQRAFARGIAEEMSKSAAQIGAGYKPNRKNANLLLLDERVLAEIERVRSVIEFYRYQNCGLDESKKTESH